MFSLKALWSECNPHKAPDQLNNCHSNSIHHAEANTIDDALSTTQNEQGASRLQAFYLDQLEPKTAVKAPFKGASRLLPLLKAVLNRRKQ